MNFTPTSPSRRPRSELSLALIASDWPQALRLLKSEKAMKLASTYCALSGFFEGLKDAYVLPLHQACAVADIDIQVIHALLKVYPAAVHMTESSYQRLPLHCACRTGASPAVIQALLETERVHGQFHGNRSNTSWCCLQPDSLARLPLHYALSNGANYQVVALLLAAAPSAAAGLDRRGWTPLHVASNAGSSLQVLEAVYKAHPEAIELRTLTGSTPLRCLNRTVHHRNELKEFLKQAKAEYAKHAASQPAAVNNSKPGGLLQRASSCSNVNSTTTTNSTSPAGAENITAPFRTPVFGEDDRSNDFWSDLPVSRRRQPEQQQPQQPPPPPLAVRSASQGGTPRQFYGQRVTHRDAEADRGSLPIDKALLV